MGLAKKIIKEIELQNSDALNSDGLLSGRLGVVYYYYILYKHFGAEEFLEKVCFNLDLVLQNIENQNSSLLFNSALQSGLSGLGYVLRLLMNDDVLDDSFKDQIDEISNLACREALRLIEDKNFDFMNGPIGILHYLNFAGHKEYVEEIVAKLYEEFEKDPNFVFYNQAKYLEGMHIGYAHGICAIVKVFDGIEDYRCDIMIKRILEYLIDTASNSDVEMHTKKYYLPRSIHKNSRNEAEANFRAVLAWSNSDFNFTTLIYSIKEKHIMKEARDLADRIALESIERKNRDQTRVWDHRFFFGSAGVLQMYNYMYQKTEDIKFYNACKHWYSETLGFININTVEEHPLDFINNLPATALALLEFEESKSLNWSNLLLL